MGIVMPPPPASLVHPPVREGFLRKARRWYRTRKSFSGLTQWFLDFGSFMVVFFGLLFFVDTYRRNLKFAYSVMIGEAKPWENGGSFFTAVPLSIISWLAIPAIIGGTAGYIISRRIDGYTHKVTATVYRSRRSRLRDKITLPPRIPWLGDWHTHSHYYKRRFVNEFVRVAHGNDWVKAQNHWELVLAAYLSTQDVAGMTRRHRFSSAQGKTRQILYAAARRGKCPVCRARSSTP